jgi:hypothetical protein
VASCSHVHTTPKSLQTSLEISTVGVPVLMSGLAFYKPQDLSIWSFKFSSLQGGREGDNGTIVWLFWGLNYKIHLINSFFSCLYSELDKWLLLLVSLVKHLPMALACQLFWGVGVSPRAGQVGWEGGRKPWCSLLFIPAILFGGRFSRWALWDTKGRGLLQLNHMKFHFYS